MPAARNSCTSSERLAAASDLVEHRHHHHRRLGWRQARRARPAHDISRDTPMETPVAGTCLASEACHQVVITPTARHRAEHDLLAVFVLDGERSAAPRTPRQYNNPARAPRWCRTSPGRGHSRRPANNLHNLLPAQFRPCRADRAFFDQTCRSGCRCSSSSFASGATKARIRCAWSAVQPCALGKVAGLSSLRPCAQQCRDTPSTPSRSILSMARKHDAAL